MDGIGNQIRGLRKRRGWTLSEMSERSGLSVSFLSQVERELFSLSISSLKAICDALDLPLSRFFALSGNSSVVLKAGERRRLHIEGSEVTYISLSGPLSERVLEPIIGEFPPHYDHPLITHRGEEFGYILEGSLILQIRDREYHLEPGDSFHLLSTEPHSIRNQNASLAKVLWILTQKFLELEQRKVDPATEMIDVAP